MLPPKLRHIFGCLAFSEKKFRQKKDPTLVKSLFENTRGNLFLDFFNVNQSSLKKSKGRKMGLFFSNLLLESIFNFMKWPNGKHSNTRICVFSVFFIFVKKMFGYSYDYKQELFAHLGRFLGL